MKKLNQVIYEKLILQAEEAKEQNMTKLANAILGSLTTTPAIEDELYSVADLNRDIYQDLWKVATNVLKYHDLKSVNAEKVDEVVEIFAEKFINELEQALSIPAGTIGPLEPKLLGESK